MMGTGRHRLAKVEYHRQCLFCQDCSDAGVERTSGGQEENSEDHEICMRLVKVERARWTNPRYEAELAQPNGLMVRVRGRESGPTAGKVFSFHSRRVVTSAQMGKPGKKRGQQDVPMNLFNELSYLEGRDNSTSIRLL